MCVYVCVCVCVCGVGGWCVVYVVSGGWCMVCGVVYGVWCVQICMDVRERAAGAGVERGGYICVEVGKARRSGYTTGGRTRKIEEKVDRLS